MSTSNTILKKLIEFRVQVHYQSGVVDTGILEDCDEQWIQLRKENDETLYIATVNVRLVKALT